MKKLTVRFTDAEPWHLILADNLVELFTEIVGAGCKARNVSVSFTLNDTTENDE